MDMSNFVCLESWDDFLDVIKESSGEDVANECARQIIKYGTKGVMTTGNDIIKGLINTVIKPIIDKSQKRYAACKNNGEQGGREPEYDHDKMIELYERGLNKNQIAKELNCSYSAVRNVIAKYESEKNDEI